MFIVEFFADKIPYVDSVWDVIHTFIRIPAGAIVAYGATHQLDPSIYVPAVLLGGGLATAAHGSKAALRVGANFSPEPVTNWILSFIEDGIAIVGVAACGLCARRDHVGARDLCAAFRLLRSKSIPCPPTNVSRCRGLFRGESFAEVARKAG